MAKRKIPRRAKIAAAKSWKDYYYSIRKNTRDRGGYMVGAPANDGTSGHVQWANYKAMWKRQGPNYLKNLRRDVREGRYKK